jgi:hypothetical protein
MPLTEEQLFRPLDPLYNPFLDRYATDPIDEDVIFKKELNYDIYLVKRKKENKRRNKLKMKL